MKGGISIPYIFEKEKLKLTEKQDRRIKLTLAQKDFIRVLYSQGGNSLNALAKKFGVSKKTILLIVNPESKKKNDERIKNHWKDYYDKEKLSKAQKQTRQYKADLFRKGMLH